MKTKKLLLPLIICLLFVGNVFAGMSVSNYFQHPAGTSSSDNMLVITGTQEVQSGGVLDIQSGASIFLSGTVSSSGTVTFTSQPTFSAGINVDEDVDIDFNAADEEFNLTTSSGGQTAAMTLYNSTTDLEYNQYLLDLTFKDNGDANGIYLRCVDNSAADTVLQIGGDGAITIDASGGGSGTVLSEATMVVNDAAFDWDSETQDLNIGDGTNDVNITDNGVMTFAGTAYIDSETNDLEIGDGTNRTVFSDDGVISQEGDAQASLLDVTIAGTGLNCDSDIDWDGSDATEEVNFTSYSDAISVVTIYNSTAAVASGTELLNLNFADDGDADGIFLACKDNAQANTVLSIGQDGKITIDVSGAGSGTVLTEASLVANDAAFTIDSETQDLYVGDGTNGWTFTDNGVVTAMGTGAYVDSETADFEVGDGTNKTTFTDDGAITQAGDAQASLLDVTLGGTAPVISTVKFATTDANVVPVVSYHVYVTTTMADNTDYLFTDADGKAGSFKVIGSTYIVQGTFGTDGAVTLVDTIPNVGTTNGNDTDVSVYDAGTYPALDNQSGSSVSFYIEIWYKD